MAEFDAPWLNLNPDEIRELRNVKNELTEYGKDKIQKLMRKNMTDRELVRKNMTDQGPVRKDVTDREHSEALEAIAKELGGTLTYSYCCSKSMEYKKITIEYDHKKKKN